MSATSNDGIRGLDAELTEEPTRASLANILALMLTAPDDDRALGAFDLAWKIADHLQRQGEVELFVRGDDWQEIKAQAVELADTWRRESA